VFGDVGKSRRSHDLSCARRNGKRNARPSFLPLRFRSSLRWESCSRIPVNVSMNEDRMSIENRLAELGITLPDAPAPAANYVPFARSGNLVFVSGQISADENGLIIGKLG